MASPFHCPHCHELLPEREKFGPIIEDPAAVQKRERHYELLRNAVSVYNNSFRLNKAGTGQVDSVTAVEAMLAEIERRNP